MKFESVIKVGMERWKLNFSLKNLQLCKLNMIVQSLKSNIES